MHNIYIIFTQFAELGHITLFWIELKNYMTSHKRGKNNGAVCEEN